MLSMEDRLIDVRSDVLADRQVIQALNDDIEQDQAELADLQTKIARDISNGDFKALAQDLKSEAQALRVISLDLKRLSHAQDDLQKDEDRLDRLNTELGKL